MTKRPPPPVAKGEFTSTATTGTGDHTQVVDVKGGLTKAGLQLLPVVQVTSGSDQGRLFSLFQIPRVTIGRSKDSTLVLVDPSCSRQHAEIYLAPDQTAWIRDLDSTNGTKINGTRIQAETQLKDGDRLQLGDNTILRFSLMPEEEARVQMDVYHRATRDALTGAYNRRQFDEFVSRELSYLTRSSNQGLGLIILDVDHFKKINDSFGHLAGDEVLRELGRRVPSCVRNEDIFARIGGEEFAVICRNENLEGVQVLAERIRIAMEQTPASFEGRGILFTVSVGYTFVPPKTTLTQDQLIGTTDEALYEAKHAGRNRSVMKQVPKG